MLQAAMAGLAKNLTSPGIPCITVAAGVETASQPQVVPVAWVEVVLVQTWMEDPDSPLRRTVRQTQVAVAVVMVIMPLGMAAQASSSSATRPPPAATKAAARTITTTGRTASRARLARRGCPKRLTSAYARKTTTAASTAVYTRAPRALRVPHGYRAIPSRAVTRRRAPARCHRHHRLHPPRRWKRSQRRRAIPSSPTSPTRD